MLVLGASFYEVDCLLPFVLALMLFLSYSVMVSEYLWPVYMYMLDIRHVQPRGFGGG